MARFVPVSLCLSSYYCVPARWTVRDAPIVAVLAELVGSRSDRDFRKCRNLLKREDHTWNHQRIYRVYKLMCSNLCPAAKRRLPERLRVPLYVLIARDTVWSCDFVSDTLANGRWFRTFYVVDDFNREVLHIEIDTSITLLRLVRVFERLRSKHRLPQVLTHVPRRST